MATLTEPVYTPAKAQGRIIEFKGYNARGDIEDGEMRDMKNLTADEYPAIYQRPARNTWQENPEGVEYASPQSLLVKSHFRADGSEVVQQEAKLAVISRVPDDEIYGVIHKTSVNNGTYLGEAFAFTFGPGTDTSDDNFYYLEIIQSDNVYNCVVFAFESEAYETGTSESYDYSYHHMISNHYEFTLGNSSVSELISLIDSSSNVDEKIQEMTGYSSGWRKHYATDCKVCKQTPREGMIAGNEVYILQSSLSSSTYKEMDRAYLYGALDPAEHGVAVSNYYSYSTSSADVADYFKVDIKSTRDVDGSINNAVENEYDFTFSFFRKNNLRYVLRNSGGLIVLTLVDKFTGWQDDYRLLESDGYLGLGDGYAFYYDGIKYLTGLSENTQMVAINTKICFFPQKKYFKLVCDDNEDRIGDIDAELSIDAEGTCHIGPNEDLNFYSSTLTLPSSYNIQEYGFEVGDAVDINITSAPKMLLRRKYTNDPYFIYFCTVYEINDNYTLLSNVSCYKADDQATLDAAYDSLETWEGYQALWPQREPNATKYEGINARKTIPGSRVTEIYKLDDEVLLKFPVIYKNIWGAESTFYATIPFDVDEIVNYSSEGQYMANGVAPVSGVVQDIKGNTITLGDNSFTDTLGNQFNDVDVPFQSISITRKSPDLDFVMEHNNRLWGVSNKDNTIYASKLGDPTNWAYFQNTALDSYYAEQGSDGEWTGCAPYSSHLLFFKEDCIHKVYGSFPSEYQIQTSICHGVEKGSSKSIVFMNDAVLYKSRVGIMGYAGGSPQLISPQFGNEKYKNVVAGTDGRRYYACMETKSGDHVLMVYDTEYQEWHKQDDLEVLSFAYINGKVVYVEKDNQYIMEMASDVPETDPIQWMAVLGPFDEYIENKKVYSRLKMRYKMPTGSSFSVYIAVDDEYDDNQWTLVEAVTETNELTQELFFMPSRCDQFAIKIVGSGYCKIKSMVREYRTSTMKKENY